MKGEDFCPLCGKTKVPFIRGLCRECFLKKNPPVEIPDKVAFRQCSGCEKILISGKTIVPDEQALSKAVEKAIKIRGLEKPAVDIKVSGQEGLLSADVTVKGIADSVPLLFRKTISLDRQLFQCDSCMRLRSDCWEAKVQLRSRERKALETGLARMQGLLDAGREQDSLSAVIKAVKVKNGVDVFVGSKRAAYHAVKQLRLDFNAEVKQSFKLVGVDKSGKQRKRATYSVRL